MSRFFPSFSFHSKAHLIAIAMIVVSMLQGLLGHSGAPWLLFAPFRTLFRLEIWRPFTSLFVATSPPEIIFGALIIYSIGGMLEQRWTRKRFLAVALGIPLIAQVFVLILTFISPSMFHGLAYPGARQVISTLWIIFGLAAHFSHERLNFWGTPITGKTFALIGLGFVVLNAVFGGVILVLPELITAALCYVYMYRNRWLRWKDRLALKYYDWKLQRLKGRTNLRVIKGARSDQEDEDDPGPQIH
jgi:membrane associated rhomboid family serine protease